MGPAIVTYFSVAGFTADAAGRLADAISADLYEIQPQAAAEPGSEKANLNQLKFLDLPDISGYDSIFVGLPIWWYAAPTVINHFLEQFDLHGKTIVPFATSGGGGLDKVKARMAESCPGARLMDASLLSGDMDLEELADWAEKAVR